MNDEDTILTMYPAPDVGYSNAIGAIKHNKERDMKRSNPATSKVSPSIKPVNERTRESTAEPEQVDKQEQVDVPDSENGYRLTFSNGAKTSFGFVIGCDPQSDFVLKGIEDIKRISRYHFAFQFDDEYRLIVKDLTSTWGTSVKYGDQDRGLRVGTHWIISGCPFVEQEGMDIVVKVVSSLKFLVKVPIRNIHSPEYREKVDRFRQGMTGTEDLFRKLQIRTSQSTERPSKPLTPHLTYPVICTKDIGKGAFGKVTYHWNAKTGEEYAVKVPTHNKYVKSEWEHEAMIMGRISHPHVVRFLGATYDPQPSLSIEYMWGGSLVSHLAGSEGFSRFETVQVLRQATDALEYLHGLKITHRDISTSNILVYYRNPDSIFIKLADFGLAKEGRLATFCGNKVYLAPEIYENSESGPDSEGYTSAVDIWSTGVVVTELLCGLPDGFLISPNLFNIGEYVREYHHETRDPLPLFLISSMLVVKAKKRASASECHQGALRLPDGDKTPRKLKQSSFKAVTDGSTFRIPVNEGPGRFRGQDGLDGASLDRYIVGVEEFGTVTHEKNRSQVRRLLDKMKNPEHRLFVGSVVNGLGGDFDIKDGTSIISDAAKAISEGETAASQPVQSSPSDPITSPSTAIWN
ncbi:hypothetical protein GQX73_g10609 [Xylaria multiplex]|uniref:EKC/KEOPS complex subunit BUD32 n=1 Tax=Xylaria multiplex TaxID=323545 RepID=A0A7C8IK04_9PEZI|nr:hypothetical protein GQX73_g10609 [Xylaria multiplex]